MKEKTSFLLYSDYLDCIEGFNDAQTGQLFRAILAARKGEQVNISDQAVKVAFNFINSQIERDEKKFQETSEKRSNSGKEGGAPRGNQNARKQTKTNENNQKQAKSSKIKQNKLIENEYETETKVSNKFETCKAPAETKKQQEDKRKPHITSIIDWFAATYGFPPTDLRPRFIANNILRGMVKFCRDTGQEPTDERIGKALAIFLNWFGSNEFHNGTQKLQTVAKKFAVWRAEVENKRKQVK